MAQHRYINKNFKQKSLDTIETANEIIEDWKCQGFDLTLRQLYYQFVARALIPNTERSYKNLGSLVNDARLAGMMDWNAIVDRTRPLDKLASWKDPAEIIETMSRSFRIDMWKNQPEYVEVWVEKEALKGIVEKICNELRVPFFACRGYVSQSAQWRASQRLLRQKKHCTILHLGDHDPSGIDMTRDISHRLTVFNCFNHEVKRIALNMDQIEQYQPPPNPAKLSDTRARDYIADYGHESWELDALPPSVITELIQKHVEELRDDDQWAEDDQQEDEYLEQLEKTYKLWDEVVEFLEDQEMP